MDQTKFRDIFLDARVIDIDFSQWDQRVRFVVVAKEETDLAVDGRLPIYAIDFVRVLEIDFRFNYLDAEVDGHCKWNACIKECSYEAGEYLISLAGLPDLASVRVRCKDVEITSINASLIDKVNPGWAVPMGPLALARPGLVELANGVEWNDDEILNTVFWVADMSFSQYASAREKGQKQRTVITKAINAVALTRALTSSYNNAFHLARRLPGDMSYDDYFALARHLTDVAAFSVFPMNISEEQRHKLTACLKTSWAQSDPMRKAFNDFFSDLEPEMKDKILGMFPYH